MYLPAWIGGLGVFFLIAAAVCLILGFAISAGWLVACVICLLLGIAALMCRRNQWIEITGSDTFVYSTMFGRKTEYHFSDIQDIKIGSDNDSYTMIMSDGKVHIEDCAVMSEKFIMMSGFYERIQFSGRRE